MGFDVNLFSLNTVYKYFFLTNYILYKCKLQKNKSSLLVQKIRFLLYLMAAIFDRMAAILDLWVKMMS